MGKVTIFLYGIVFSFISKEGREIVKLSRGGFLLIVIIRFLNGLLNLPLQIWFHFIHRLTQIIYFIVMTPRYLIYLLFSPLLYFFSRKKSSNLSPSPRVLMITENFHPLSRGGAEHQCERLSKALHEKGISVSVVAARYNVELERKSRLYGYGVVRLTRFGWCNVLVYYYTLFTYLIEKRKEYDIIHLHLLHWFGVMAILAAKLVNKKIVVKFACTEPYGEIAVHLKNPDPVYSEIWFKSYSSSDCIIAISSDVKKELIEHGFDQERIQFLPNGVDEKRFIPKELPSLSDSSAVLTFVGRLDEQKGVVYLLKAFREVSLKKEKEAIHLQLLGEGPLEVELKDLVKELAIEDRTTFVGYTDKVKDYLAKTDIFILPTLGEGLSNSLLEAMAMELPIIATKVSGNVDAIKDGYNGLLVDSKSSSALAEKIELLLSDRLLAHKLGKNARTTIEENYSFDYISDQYIKVYNKLLQNNSERLKDYSYSFYSLWGFAFKVNKFMISRWW